MKKWFLIALGALLFWMFCFNTFGYAALTAELELAGDMTWKMPEGVIITGVIRNTAEPGDGTWDSGTTTFSKSVLTSKVSLSGSGSSYVTLSVTVYNNTDVAQGFDKVLDGKEDGFYSNEDIVYEMTNLERKRIVDKVFYDGTQIQPGAYHTFELTFAYDGGKAGASPDLSSVLNFVFKPYSDIVADEFVTPLEEGPLAQFKRILNNPVSYKDLIDTIQAHDATYKKSYIGNVAGANTTGDSGYVYSIFKDPNGKDTLYLDFNQDGVDEPVTVMIKHNNVDGNTATGTDYINKANPNSQWDQTAKTYSGGEMILFMTPTTITSSVRSVTVYAAVFTSADNGVTWTQLGEMYQGTATTNNYEGGSWGTRNSFNTDTWRTSIRYYNLSTNATLEQVMTAYKATQATNETEWG